MKPVSGWKIFSPVNVFQKCFNRRQIMKIFEANRTYADIVLSILNTMLDDNDDVIFEKHDYINGREHGYALELTFNKRYIYGDERIWIAFSENRNSDDTVVYDDVGEWNGKITEKSWQDASYFKYGDFYKCAEYIYNLMKLAVKNTSK